MPGPVQSVERAAAILRLLAAETEPVAMSRIADAVGLAKGTTHGLLLEYRRNLWCDRGRTLSRYHHDGHHGGVPVTGTGGRGVVSVELAVS
jgi:hypothetical protein